MASNIISNIISKYSTYLKLKIHHIDGSYIVTSYIYLRGLMNCIS